MHMDNRITPLTEGQKRELITMIRNELNWGNYTSKERFKDYLEGLTDGMFILYHDIELSTVHAIAEDVWNQEKGLDYGRF